jgi:hypothetical protein
MPNDGPAYPYRVIMNALGRAERWLKRYRWKLTVSELTSLYNELEFLRLLTKQALDEAEPDLRERERGGIDA